MNLTEKLKKIPNYLRTNKIAVIILMAFVFLYLINQDLFLNNLNNDLKTNSSAIIRLNNKIKTLKNITVSLTNEKNELLNLKNQVISQRLKLKKERIKLPKTFMISTLIKDISESAPISNFIIEKIYFGKQVKFQGVMALPVNISIIGGFNKSIKFVKNINSLERIFVINYISVKASKKSFPDIKTDIKGFVYSTQG